MNIFALHKDEKQSAIWHTDKHVIKMILESAQMLSTVYWYYGQQAPYKPTHVKHPCVLWARQNKSNYQWLVNLALALCDEYTFRYNKIHKSLTIIQELKEPPSNMPIGELTAFAQAMPDNLKMYNPILAYQYYYIEKKIINANWKNRGIPEFILNINKEILFHIFYSTI